MEAALVTIIVGVGTLGLMELLAAGGMSNRSAADLTAASNLVKNVHEMCLSLAFNDPVLPTHWGAESGEVLATYNDLDDLDGQSFSPPIDARRQSLTQFTGWSQSVVVHSVDPNKVTLNVTNGSTTAIRVTVTIYHNNKVVLTESWLAFDATP